MPGTKICRLFIFILVLVHFTLVSCHGQEDLIDYSGPTLETRIKAPQGYERIEVKPGSFAAWLRKMPVKPGKGTIHLYNGLP